MTKVLKTVTWAATIMIVLLIASLYCLSTYLNRPFHIPNNEERFIQLDSSHSHQYLIPQLIEHHLIDTVWPLKIYLKLSGIADHFHAGVYNVSSSDSLNTLLERMKNAKVLQISFRIKEGESIYQLVKRLDSEQWIKNPTNLKPYTHDFSSAEGLFYPDTYQFAAGSTAASILSVAFDKRQAELQTIWQNRDTSIPYKNPYQLLIAASIIEKESSQHLDRQRVSGVIVNRLIKRMPLQMDPTVVYALGEDYTGRLKKRDLQIDSPFNTYQHKGLPPTPIATISSDALYAAAHPEHHRFLYFVAKGDGAHAFSETYAEQLTAIKRYLGNS